MKFLSVKEIAVLWNISERTVRNYCAHGMIPGAFLTGKTWLIPEGATKPVKEKKIEETDNELLNHAVFENASCPILSTFLPSSIVSKLKQL